MPLPCGFRDEAGSLRQPLKTWTALGFRTCLWRIPAHAARGSWTSPLQVVLEAKSLMPPPPRRLVRRPACDLTIRIAAPAPGAHAPLPKARTPKANLRLAAPVRCADFAVPLAF